MNQDKNEKLRAKNGIDHMDVLFTITEDSDKVVE